MAPRGPPGGSRGMVGGGGGASNGTVVKLHFDSKSEVFVRVSLHVANLQALAPVACAQTLYSGRCTGDVVQSVYK